MFNIRWQLTLQGIAEQTNWSLEKESIPSLKVTLILNKCARTNLSELNESDKARIATTRDLTWSYMVFQR
jgi:hypothetical protein